MKENPIREKSFAFALRVLKLAKSLERDKKEFVLSRQVLRSGTANGALIREAEHAESKADFIHKMSIALKEQMRLCIGSICCTTVNAFRTRALN
jgi:four helix bundle protein